MKKLLFHLIGVVAFTICACTDDPSSSASISNNESENVLQKALNDIPITAQLYPLGKYPGFNEAYEVYFSHPVNHADTSGEKFQQKTYILFKGFDHPTLFYTCGYSIFSLDYEIDLAENMDANIIIAEHRYFGKSLIQNDPKWNHLTIEESANDLHDVYMALKPLLTKEWVSTGTSKDGMTALFYRYFYPDDMDVTVSFATPLLTDLHDIRTSVYMHDTSGTDYERDIMHKTIARWLSGKETMLPKLNEIVRKKFEVSTDLIEESFYATSIFQIFFSLFSYQSESVREIIIEALAKATDEELLDYIATNITQNVDENSIYPYFVQTAKELGLNVYDFSPYDSIFQRTDFDLSSLNENPSGLRPEDLWLYNTYDNSVIMDVLNKFLPTTDKPIMMVYAKNDPWTGARPAKVNEKNVKIIIDPTATHSHDINDRDYYTKETSDAIMEFIAQYVNYEKPNQKLIVQRKILHKKKPPFNDQFMIRRRW